ncbi:MAG: shikimate kinase [Planctomycetales bacterium]
MNIALIGYRACGKTTVAQHLGSRLGWEWIDCDVALETRAGKSIKQMFDDDGEPAFRALEAEILGDLSRRDRVILATGGGAVLRDDNRKALQDHCSVVWLRASVETILRRLSQDETTAGRRPALTNLDQRQEVERVLAAREPLYRAAADLDLDADEASPSELAGAILRRLGLSSPASETA